MDWWLAELWQMAQDYLPTRKIRQERIPLHSGPIVLTVHGYQSTMRVYAHDDGYQYDAWMMDLDGWSIVSESVHRNWLGQKRLYVVYSRKVPAPQERS